jgi:hypothetical protein
MTEILSKPFQVGHLDLFACHPAHKERCYESANYMEQLGQIGQCASQIVDGRILYIGAYFHVAPGVVEVFLIPSVYISRYAKSFYRQVKWWLMYLLGQPGVKRLQTWGEDTDQSRNWLSRLGFQQEGLLYCYGPKGESVTIWGLVAPCKQ